MKVDLVSDVICPWCLIGFRRLEQAIARSGRDDVDVELHPFLLDPGTPPEGADLRARLREKYRVDPESMFGRVEATARLSGIPLDFSRVHRTFQTAPAHTLLRHARARGTQRPFAHALFDAYFLEGRDLGDVAELATLAAAHGFDRDEARALASSAEELALTRADAEESAHAGVTGVPFFVFDGKVAVSGAHPVEVLARALAGEAG